MRNIFIFLCVIILQGCLNNKTREITNEDFINNFINENSSLIFREEIERIQINYFKNSNSILYNFERLEKLESNGNLFLQLYPFDKSKLPVNRRKYSFINLLVDKSEIQQVSKRQNFISQKLHLPYSIKSLRTGQTLNNKKQWEFFLPNDKDSLILKNKAKYSLNLGLESSYIKVYSNKNNSIYYDVNSNSIKINSIKSYNSNIEINALDDSDDVLESKMISINNIGERQTNKYSFDLSKEVKTLQVKGLEEKCIYIDVYQLIRHIKDEKLLSLDLNKKSSSEKTYLFLQYLMSENLFKKLINESIKLYINYQKKNIYVIIKAEDLSNFSIYNIKTNETLPFRNYTIFPSEKGNDSVYILSYNLLSSCSGYNITYKESNYKISK